jgi:hypothetical protein
MKIMEHLFVVLVMFVALFLIKKNLNTSYHCKKKGGEVTQDVAGIKCIITKSN